VAFKGTETDDLFSDGENVVFADRLDGAAFAAAVLRIAGDAALAGRLSAGAAALYERHLSWPRIGEQLLAVI
jgi:glycosyltransferase involved in cell wall biosynthesis